MAEIDDVRSIPAFQALQRKKHIIVPLLEEKNKKFFLTLFLRG